MAKVSGNDLVVQALKDEGVDTAFYLTGGPMVDVALRCLEAFRTIDVRHEQAAAMAAHAYSRVSGKPGVCFAASGPGTTNLITGVGNAFLDAVPVVALGGASAVAQQGMGAFQEMDQVGMFKPITKWAERVIDARRIPEIINKAFRVATSGQPGPVYVDLPGDVLYKRIDESEVLYFKKPHEAPRLSGDPAMVKRAIALLKQAKRPLILTGTGVFWSRAWDELREFVELSGIPFYTTPQGRGVIAEDHKLSFLGARNQAWKEADVVLVVGTRFNFIIGFGLPPRWAEDVKFIQVDISDEEIGRNRPVDVGIVGDAKVVLQQLLEEGRDAFKGLKESPWIETLRGYDQRAEEKSRALLNSDAVPIHPLRLFKEVRDFMDRDAIIVVDGHETLNFARQSIPTNSPGHRVNAGPNGCMGVAVPFGLGAKVAKPDTQVIVLSGDGSFGMNGMEIDTLVRHNIPVLNVVSNNGGWAGVGGMNAGRDLGFSRYDKMAEVFGGYGEYVDKPQDIRAALERARASGKPAVVNVITDPNARSSTVSFANYRAI
ncbi:MAG TPA: thiamine pyrophosphate-binding protein [Candidatus Binataceae bacterium]|nr:thiamine pyrophosphate-binding protein [Candidatus Binataceae bacterium]